MTHVQMLTAMLQTDLLRLEATLFDKQWSVTAQQRVQDFLARLTALIALVAADPVAPAPTPTNADDALTYLNTLTATLLTVLNQCPPDRQNAIVLDAHERNFTLLGHCYDYARLSAMLVEWAQGLPDVQDELADWFD